MTTPASLLTSRRCKLKIVGMDLWYSGYKYVRDSLFLPAATQVTRLHGSYFFLGRFQKVLDRFVADSYAIASPNCGQLILPYPNVDCSSGDLQAFRNLVRGIKVFRGLYLLHGGI